MRRRVAVFLAVDVQHSTLEVDLLPSKANQLADAQPVAIGKQDQRSVSQSVPPHLRCGGDQALDLGRSKVVAPDLSREQLLAELRRRVLKARIVLIDKAPSFP